MKKTFKYILTVAALSTAALASEITVAAQTLAEGEYEGKNGIAYRKSSTLKPGTTDTYIINLETFVTGGVTIKQESIPADIVLVLDVSGSMDEHMYSYRYNARSNQGYSYWNLRNSTYYFKHTDGNYYAVSRDDGWSGRYHYYYLSYTAQGTTYYLSGTGTSTELTYNVVVWDDDDTIWTGVLYERQDQDLGTKMDNLKTAVNSFIDEIHHNDLYDDDGNRRKGKSGADTTLGNQIAIVKFAGATYYSNGRTTQTPNTVEGNNTYQDGWYTYNATQVRKRFSPTATATDVQTLKNAVNSLTARGATAADYGMTLARMLLDEIKDTRTESSKTVVFFTDGSPTHSRSFEPDVASDAIGESYTVKNDYKANVFSIGVFSDLGDDEEDVETYMNFVSSNYPKATDMSQGGNPVPPAQRNFYQNASGADLSEIFKTIAQASGGSGNTDVSSESAVTVDVVASSFHLPEGVTADDITVTVAPCTGQKKAPRDSTDDYKRFYYTFGPAKPAKGTDYSGTDGYPLPAVTPVVDAEHNMVSTSGFDFSANWCGYDESVPEWRGYKQIISFEIKVNETAVGGPNVPTNDSNSGIYVNGAPVATFNRPEVRIPISIWIKKKGLLEEDSAVFTVEYATYERGKDPRTLPKSAWKSFTKVLINNTDSFTKDTDGYPVVKLVGLDPDFFYRIREDAWAWTYTYRDQGIQYIYGEDQQNPFVFTNEPKSAVKEAEATVQNKFNEKVGTSATSE